MMNLTLAIMTQVAAVEINTSKSLAKCRFRLRHARVCSATHHLRTAVRGGRQRNLWRAPFPCRLLRYATARFRSGLESGDDFRNPENSEKTLSNGICESCHEPIKAERLQCN